MYTFDVQYTAYMMLSTIIYNVYNHIQSISENKKSFLAIETGEN